MAETFDVPTEEIDRVVRPLVNELLRATTEVHKAHAENMAELGYDDVLLTRANHSEADLPEADLIAIRSLLPRQ